MLSQPEQRKIDRSLLQTFQTWLERLTERSHGVVVNHAQHLKLSIERLLARAREYRCRVQANSHRQIKQCYEYGD